jgi:hypothetical protein
MRTNLRPIINRKSPELRCNCDDRRKESDRAPPFRRNMSASKIQSSRAPKILSSPESTPIGLPPPPLTVPLNSEGTAGHFSHRSPLFRLPISAIHPARIELLDDHRHLLDSIFPRMSFTSPKISICPSYVFQFSAHLRVSLPMSTT